MTEIELTLTYLNKSENVDRIARLSELQDLKKELKE